MPPGIARTRSIIGGAIVAEVRLIGRRPRHRETPTTAPDPAVSRG
jgi:hypothetical protein